MSSSSIPISTITSLSSASDVKDDPVTPSQDKIIQTLARSRQLWQSLSGEASLVDLQRGTVRLSGLNHGLPAIPDDLQGRTELTGQATWRMWSTGCTVPGEARNEAKRRWKPARLRPTLCMISDHSSFNHLDSKSNGIAFLFFGWAYILCMSLLEKQHVSMSYANMPQVPWDESDSDRCLTIDIREVSGEEYCWWASLLSPGQGWRSVTPEQPVWAIAYTANFKFRLEARIATTGPLQFTPPSSKQAVAFLSRFASMYNLDGQAPLALAMALTLPLHNETSSMVKLPKPSLVKNGTRLSCASSFDREYSNLAHYMTLSSNPVFLSSALWGIFWEPGIDCNLVSSWYDPIIEVVKPIIECNTLEKLGHVFALRRPQIAPLWYGIAACGHTKTVLGIIPFLRTLHSPVPSRPIPEVAAWTDSPQSFMDLQGLGPYVHDNNRVARTDVWRLRHQFWDIEPEGAHFRNPPTCPWPPFGFMAIEELEIPVHTHINCRRHHCVYSRWTWFFDDGTEILDEPTKQGNGLEFENGVHLISPQDTTPASGYILDHMASERAVCDIFRWAAPEMEVSGKYIYTHPWVDALLDLDMDNDEETDSGSGGSLIPSNCFLQRIIDWVIEVNMHGKSTS
ncbi:hypothetical protein XA68_11489 [Ophiocordyceps unilateralis]|uniref:Uncharacterized protein n=1 Tax=Ophiocordyceps unilateralis TaxID=268505 RepID=A0A2A9PGC0_OPHUN|nr:hypothetical protein XA68_11489 [Ophiocordyceps unilateralis]